jgi:hypothetical protein
LIALEHSASSELSEHCDTPSHFSWKGIGYPSGQKWGSSSSMQFSSSEPSVQWFVPSHLRVLGMVYPSGQVWTESSIPAIENNQSSYVNVNNKNNLQIKDSLFDLMNFILILKTIFEIEN